MHLFRNSAVLVYIILSGAIIAIQGETQDDSKQLYEDVRAKRAQLDLASFPLAGTNSSPGYGGSGITQLLQLPSLYKHQFVPSPSDIAIKAAGEATKAAASQKDAAFKAAKEAAKKIAAKASVAAQKAQAAASNKYAQAAWLTQAVQAAHSKVFKGATQTAKSSRTVKAAEALKVLALSQMATLQQALAASEAQATVAQQVLAAAASTYWEQSAMLKNAQKIAREILHKQMLAIRQLSSAQAAAEKARSAATESLYKAHGALGK